MSNILPDSRTTGPGRIIQSKAGTLIPIFCANCGKEGGAVPAENMTFAYWLCNPCAETYGEVAGLLYMPDQVFYELVKQEQLAKYGRIPTIEEIVVLLDDPHSLESKLARDRVALTPKPGR